MKTGSLWDWKLRMRKKLRRCWFMNEFYDFLVYLEANWPLCWRVTFHFWWVTSSKNMGHLSSRHIHELSTPPLHWVCWNCTLKGDSDKKNQPVQVHRNSIESMGPQRCIYLHEKHWKTHAVTTSHWWIWKYTRWRLNQSIWNIYRHNGIIFPMVLGWTSKKHTSQKPPPIYLRYSYSAIHNFS